MHHQSTVEQHRPFEPVFVSNFDHSDPNGSYILLVFTKLAAEEMVIALVEANDPARAGLEPAIAGSSLRRVAFIEKFRRCN